MADRYVITLGRECGAGATYIAQHLSKELGIPYYDKDIFRMVSDKSGVLEEFFHVNSERIQTGKGSETGRSEAFSWKGYRLS